jgi:hypothetical protein
MKVQIVTSYRVSHSQRYGVTERGNVTNVYPPLMDATQSTEHEKGGLELHHSHFPWDFFR